MTSGSQGPRRRQRNVYDGEVVRGLRAAIPGVQSGCVHAGHANTESIGKSAASPQPEMGVLRARPGGAWSGSSSTPLTQPIMRANKSVLSPTDTVSPRANLAGRERVQPQHLHVDVDRDSFLGALRPAIKTAQILSLIPVSKPTDPNNVSFSWKSPRVVYTSIIITGGFLMAIMSITTLITRGVTFYTTVNVVFFTTAATATSLFLRLSSRWPELVSRVDNLETNVMRNYGYPGKLHYKMALLTVAILILSAVEHLLSMASTIAYIWTCYEQGGVKSLISGYFRTKYSTTFKVTEYRLWKGLIVLVFHIIAVFTWNFVDLFIMLVSLALVARFRQLNNVLYAASGQMQPADFWRRKRETYNALSNLTKSVDENLGPIIIVSYASNLYFICLQLLLSMNPIHSTKFHDIFFFFSLAYILLRTMGTSFFASSIYEESRKPKNVLYAVPSTSYCLEVQRFLAQVTTDHIALTGCSFFSVTRGFMLTVAGTIVTYVVVLVQFDDDDSDPEVTLTNRTITC